MIETLIWATGFIGYCLVGGVVAGRWYRWKNPNHRYSHGDNEFGAFCIGLVWFIAIFIFFGMWVALHEPRVAWYRVGREDRRRIRTEVRRKRSELYRRRLEIEMELICPHGHEWADCHYTACRTLHDRGER